MEIKLYLDKINQEMIDSARRLTPDQLAGCDIYGSWTKSCCILDFRIIEPGEEVVLPVERGLLMRKEDIGGLIWDPRTGAVYQVDEEAYHTLLELDHGFSEHEVARRMEVPEKSVQVFTRRLKKLIK